MTSSNEASPNLWGLALEAFDVALQQQSKGQAKRLKYIKAIYNGIPLSEQDQETLAMSLFQERLCLMEVEAILNVLRQQAHSRRVGSEGDRNE